MTFKLLKYRTQLWALQYAIRVMERRIHYHEEQIEQYAAKLHTGRSLERQLIRWLEVVDDPSRTPPSAS